MSPKTGAAPRPTDTSLPYPLPQESLMRRGTMQSRSAVLPLSSWQLFSVPNISGPYPSDSEGAPANWSSSCVPAELAAGTVRGQRLRLRSQPPNLCLFVTVNRGSGQSRPRRPWLLDRLSGGRLSGGKVRESLGVRSGAMENSQHILGVGSASCHDAILGDQSLH